MGLDLERIGSKYSRIYWLSFTYHPHKNSKLKWLSLLILWFHSHHWRKKIKLQVLKEMICDLVDMPDFSNKYTPSAQKNYWNILVINPTFMPNFNSSYWNFNSSHLLSLSASPSLSLLLSTCSWLQVVLLMAAQIKEELDSHMQWIEITGVK